jgi:hypothetical protein
MPLASKRQIVKIFQVKRFLFIFVKLTIESKNIELFCTQLTPVCERCVLTYSHRFDVFLCIAATIYSVFTSTSTTII